MKMALRLLMFGFLLNIAVGVAIHYIPALGASPENLRGLQYSEDDMTQFTGEFNSTIDSASAATDTSNLIDNILDKLNLGIIKKMQTWANQWMFGFTNMIGKNLLQLDDFMMNVINSLLIIAYVLAFINLFSGKDIGYG